MAVKAPEFAGLSFLPCNFINMEKVLGESGPRNFITKEKVDLLILYFYGNERPEICQFTS